MRPISHWNTVKDTIEPYDPATDGLSYPTHKRLVFVMSADGMIDVANYTDDYTYPNFEWNIQGMQTFEVKYWAERPAINGNTFPDMP